MRRYRLLIITLMMSWSAFSQTLKPILHRSDNDTLLCFSIPHAKILASKIMAGIYCDSVAQHLERKNVYLNNAMLTKDSAITSLEEKVAASEEITVNQDLMIGMLKEDLLQRDQFLKSQRKQKRVLAVVLGVVLVIVIL